MDYEWINDEDCKLRGKRIDLETLQARFKLISTMAQCVFVYASPIFHIIIIISYYE